MPSHALYPESGFEQPLIVKRNNVGQEALMKRILVLAAALLLPLAGCSNKNELRVGTGNAGGTYYSYGTELMEALKTENKALKFKVCETAGSAANIRLISDGYLQLAFTQSDMLWDAGDENAKGFSALAGLYTEACQIVVPASSDIKSVSDLYGKRVSLGEEESGVLQNAKQILFAYGMDESMTKAQYLSFTSSAEAMKNGELDAFFCTAGVPTPAVYELSKELPIRLIPVDGPQAERISEQYGGYTNCTVKAGTYVGQGEDVSTLAVKNVLVASDSLSAETVKDILEGVVAHTDVSLDFAVEDIPIGFHKGAVQYYADNGIIVEETTPVSSDKQYASADG